MPSSSTNTALPAARQWIASAAYILLTALGVHYVRWSEASTLARRYLDEILAKEPFFFADSDRTLLRQQYTGIELLDIGLSFFVAVFLPGAAGFDAAYQIQQIYFMFSLVPLLAVMSVEAGRTYNGWTVISLYRISFQLNDHTG
jgi:hypothetical protein